MFRKVLFFCVSLLIVGNCFANDVNIVIEIHGVNVGGGLVYVSVYSNEKDYGKETPSISFILEPVAAVLKHSLVLSEGEYVASAFQDANNNGKLDLGNFNIPKEPVAITNYNLRGAPGAFKDLKVLVNNNSTRIVLNMGKVRAL